MTDARARGHGGRGGNARVRGRQSIAQGGDGGEGVIGSGGPGGDADVQGDNTMAIGGPGGRGGLGEGGPGGPAVVRGDNIVYGGGEGGEARQADGRGGRGGRSGYFTIHKPDLQQLTTAPWLLEAGRGGDSGHSPQYAARLMVIEEILGHTVTMYASSVGIIDADTCLTILNWINHRLDRDQHAWRACVTAGCLEFYDI